MATRKSLVVLRDRSKLVSYKETAIRSKPTLVKTSAVKSSLQTSPRKIAQVQPSNSINRSKSVIKTPTVPAVKPAQASTEKRVSIPHNSSKLSVNNRASAPNPTPSATTTASLKQKFDFLQDKIDALGSQESRLSVIETSYERLTGDIKLLQEASSKLKDEFISVQFVLVQLVDLESKLKDSTEYNIRLAAENSELRSELTHIKSELSFLRDQRHLDKLCKALPEGGVSADQESINANIIIRGIDLDHEAGQDTLLKKFDKIRSHLGVAEVSDFEATDIAVLQPKASSIKDASALHKTIRVKFRSVDHKRRFLQVRRAKKSILPSEVGFDQKSRKPILIVEQLTKQNQELLFNARSLRTSADFKFVWSNNGQILARHRQGSKVTRIIDNNHINQLRSQFTSTQPKDGLNHPDINLESSPSDA